MQLCVRAGLISLILTAAASLASAAAPESLNVYTQITGGQEDYQVDKSMHLSNLALLKGLRWKVLARQNNLKEPYRLKKGMTLKIDNTHIVPGELADGLVINLPELGLYHFQQGACQRRYVLAVGRRTWQTPTGDYEIRNKAKKPTWIVPASIQEEMAENGHEVLDKVLPGPKNPLGEYWMGTTAPGVGLHATNRPWSVGTSASHGCVRMLPEEIADLFPQVEVGTPLKIIYQPVKMALVKDKIYLEVHPDIYGLKIDPLLTVQSLAARGKLKDRIDWDRVREIIKAKDGIAQEITLGAGGAKAATASAAPKVKELGIAPLQAGAVKIE